MIVLGIDEAGYGPLLGPLVVAGSAFQVDGTSTAEEFGPRLAAALRAAGLAVGDSKRLFGRTRDLATLETPVLAFLSAADVVGFDGVLAEIGVDPVVRLSVPWYAARLPSFPCAASTDDVAETGVRLRGALCAAGIRFLGFAADVVPESRFNGALVGRNKADALFECASDVFDRLAARRGAAETLDAVFDRHGGRRYYAAALQRRRPGAMVWRIAESPVRSDYRLQFADAAGVVRFEVKADGSHPHVGLASMLAKYVREVFMRLFNAHFAAICPHVAPTAGYVEDGRRWLAETRSARVAAGVPDSRLVRLR